MNAKLVRKRIYQAANASGVSDYEYLTAMSDTTRSVLAGEVEIFKEVVPGFVAERCHPVLGERILFSEFYSEFLRWVGAGESKHWSRRRVAREIPSDYPIGTHTGNKLWVANVSWTVGVRPSAPWRNDSGRLVRDAAKTLKLEQAVVKLANEHSSGWQGSPTQLLNVLRPNLDPAECPKSASILSHRLTALCPLFEQIGLVVVQPRRRIWSVRSTSVTRGPRLLKIGA